MRQRILALLVAAALPAAAPAIPVHWSIEGTVFEDGGTASGSFIYDADLHQYSSIFLQTTDGSIFSGNTFTATAPFQAGNIGAVFMPTQGDLTGMQFLELGFTSPLTNQGGLVPLGGPPEGPIPLEGFCNDVDCQLVTGSFATASSYGIATGVVVPLPAAVWLLGSALGVLGWAHRTLRD